MRRLRCTATGRPASVHVERAPDPSPADDGVVVRVAASNLAYVDLLLLEGGYQFTPALPFTPGTVFAGEIVDAGAATDLTIGTPVAGLTVTYGAFASHVQVGSAAVARRPATVSARVAAVAVEAYGTALVALEQRARLRPGELVLVLGAGGAVGQALLDTARSMGARTIAVISSAAGAARAELLGAELVIDRSTTELRPVLRDAVPEGVDVVADPVGGALAVPALRSLASGGRYLVIGFASGSIPDLPANQILLRGRSVLGVEWGGAIRETPAGLRPVLDRVLSGISTGVLRPPQPVPIDLDQLAAMLSVGDRPGPLAPLVITTRTS